MFETWQHGTPDAALTLSRLKEAPEIEGMVHAWVGQKLLKN